MSRATNKGVMMRYKAVTDTCLTVVGLLVEPSIDITKQKGYLGVYLFIIQPPIRITSSCWLDPPPSLAYYYSAVL